MCPGVLRCRICKCEDSLLISYSAIFSPFSLAQGPDSEELAAASRLEDDLSFYQTASPDIAKLFEIETEAKRPALVLLKKEEEKLSRFGKDPSDILLLLSAA